MSNNQPNPSTSKLSNKTLIKQVYILIIISAATIGLMLGVSAVVRRNNTSIEINTSNPATSQTAELNGSEELLLNDEQALDVIPFDDQNPDVEKQVQAIEAELDELELELIEEELSSQQLGIE